MNPKSRIILSDAVRRILRTSLKGALLFIVIVDGGFAFWPWCFSLPHVSLGYLWPGLGSRPVLLFWSGLAGLIFGGLVGLPRHWWWSLILVIGLALPFVVYDLIGSLQYYQIAFLLPFEGIYLLVLIILFGLIRAGTELPCRIKPSQKNARMIAEIASIGLLIGAGLLITLPITMLDNSPDVEILSVYETAQANGWKIQSVTFGGLVGDSITGVRIHLWDGTTLDCGYQEGWGDYLASLGKIDVMDALICPF